MRVAEILKFSFLIFFLMSAGCQMELFKTNSSADTNDVDMLSIYSDYAPTRINIVPLTEFISGDNTRQDIIKLYVSLHDSFGSQIKSPCVFRFELYQRVQRSAEPKGKRIIIWPDIDLTDHATNNEYWRDFLRAYEIGLPFELLAGQDYILQVTCLCLSGKRLSSEFILRHTE